MKVPGFLQRAHPVWIAVLAAIVEGVSCLFRFGFGLQSTRDTAWMALFTFGVRIHHGYVGAVMVLVALLLNREKRLLRRWTAYVGLALVISDLIHHFVVLWLATGAPQIDFVY